MKDLLTSAASVNKTLYFILLCMSSIFLMVAGKTMLISDELYFEFFGDQLSYDRISTIISLHKKWEWVSYAVMPVYYVLKIFLAAGCVYTGVVIAGMEISFNKIFQIALLAEGVFLFPTVVKLVWFTLIQTDYSLADLHHFYPLSAINFFERDSLDAWLIYPLQLINIFEVLYLLILAYGLVVVTRKNYARMLGLIACSYGTGLFIWTISIMFLMVHLST